MSDADVAMQTRCIWCLREQYALAVLGVSLGELGCSWCGFASTEMTREQYMGILRAQRKEHDEGGGLPNRQCTTCGKDLPSINQLLEHIDDNHKPTEQPAP